MLISEVQYLFTEIRKRFPDFMRGKNWNDEVDAWTEALPKGMTILGAMQVLENYNKPFIPNAKDFIEAGSDMYDSLMAQAFCKKQGITIEELLERQRETFWGGTR